MFELLKRKRKKRLPKSMKTLISREMYVSRRKIFVGTQYLEPVREKDFHEFLVADMTDKEEWKEGAWECDAFSLNLAAGAKRWFYRKFEVNAAVGMVWLAGNGGERGHAINFIVIPKLEIRYFEPQSDKEVFPVGRKLFVLI